MSNEEKFRGKYRTDSRRMQGWDYTSHAMYFVTICTKDRSQWFGTIHNGKMELSDVGKVATQYWSDIPIHQSCAFLDHFVVMPDHMHGILMIKHDGMNTRNCLENAFFAETHDCVDGQLHNNIDDSDVVFSAETRYTASLLNDKQPNIDACETNIQCRRDMHLLNDKQPNIFKHQPISGPSVPIEIRKNSFGPLKSQSLQSVINTFKGAVTRWCHQNGYIDFQWQRGFRDDLIRNRAVLRNMRQYIEDNPKHWDEEMNDLYPPYRTIQTTSN